MWLSRSVLTNIQVQLDVYWFELLTDQSPSHPEPLCFLADYEAKMHST